MQVEIINMTAANSFTQAVSDEYYQGMGELLGEAPDPAAAFRTSANLTSAADSRAAMAMAASNTGIPKGFTSAAILFAQNPKLDGAVADTRFDQLVAQNV